MPRTSALTSISLHVIVNLRCTTGHELYLAKIGDFGLAVEHVVNEVCSGCVSCQFSCGLGGLKVISRLHEGWTITAA